MIMKKGIAQLIAVVLIMGLVISLAAVMMIWGEKFAKSRIEETEVNKLKLDCVRNVAIWVNVTDESFEESLIVVENKGRDIAGLILKYENGDLEEKDLVMLSGDVKMFPPTSKIESEITIIPRLKYGREWVACSKSSVTWRRLGS